MNSYFCREIFFVKFETSVVIAVSPPNFLICLSHFSRLCWGKCFLAWLNCADAAYNDRQFRHFIEPLGESRHGLPEAAIETQLEGRSECSEHLDVSECEGIADKPLFVRQVSIEHLAGLFEFFHGSSVDIWAHKSAKHGGFNPLNGRDDS